MATALPSANRLAPNGAAARIKKSGIFQFQHHRQPPQKIGSPLLSG